MLFRGLLKINRNLSSQLRTFTSSAQVINPPLYDLHMSHNAKMFTYGGYRLPLYYVTTGAE